MPVSSILMSSLMSGGGGSGQGIANIAGGLLSGVTGFFQRKKAKKELAKLQRPEYLIPNEVLQNQKMAQLSASEGLPSQQYNNAMKNIQRSQTNALSGAIDRRSALMALPKLQQQANDAYGKLDVADANARMSNQRQLYDINSQVAGYRDKAFNINKLQPYQEDKNYYMNLLGSGNQNLVGGIDRVASGAGLLLGGGGSKKGRTKSNANYITSGQGYVPDGIYMDDVNTGGSYNV